MNFRRMLTRNRKGGVIVFCALALVVLLSMAGLVIDGGNLFLTRQRLQGAVDAATLGAAGQQFGTSLADRSDRALALAKLLVDRNGAGGNMATPALAMIGTNQIQVTVTTQSSPALLAALQVKTLQIGAYARAQYTPDTWTPPTPAVSNRFDPFNTHSWFTGSIFSKSSVSISNSVQVLGYNSTTGVNGLPADITTDGGFNLANSVNLTGSIKGRGDLNMSNSARVQRNAIIGGNSNMSNSARIDMNLSTNGSSQNFSNSASVGGTKTANAGVTIPVGATDLLKPIDFTVPAASNNNSSVSSSYLSNTNPPSLSLSNSTQITLAPGTYYFKDINLSNSARINLSGNVHIYLTGSMNLSNSSKFTNTDPKQLIVYSNGSANLSNSTNFYGGLYCPNGSINTSNSVQMYGGFVANQINMSNSVTFNVDSALYGNMAVANGTGNIGGTATPGSMATPPILTLTE